MNQELLQNTPPIIRDYLIYNEIVKGKSSNTVSEYYSDLQTFFRYLLRTRGMVDSEIPFQKITIERVDLELIRSVTISDLYAFLVFCKEERSNNATTRARKVSSLRLFFRYLTNYVHLLEKNPAELLDTPKIRQALPKHLTLEDSISLLECIDGPYKERDFCIITIFLNCGLRLSELCGLNLTDIRPDGTMRVLGKGNKERIVYLNQSCIDAIQAYLAVRPNDQLKDADRNALFISRQHKRISNKTVQHLVKSYLETAGLGGQGFSTHKLRHTAATLMYQHGNVDIRVLKDLLGHANLGTTQIYTHVSDQQIKRAVDANPLSTFQKK